MIISVWKGRKKFITKKIQYLYTEHLCAHLIRKSKRKFNVKAIFGWWVKTKLFLSTLYATLISKENENVSETTIKKKLLINIPHETTSRLQSQTPTYASKMFSSDLYKVKFAARCFLCSFWGLAIAPVYATQALVQSRLFATLFYVIDGCADTIDLAGGCSQRGLVCGD